MDLSQDVSWAKAHILNLAVVGVLAFGSVYAIESIIARHDAANDTKWQQILVAQTSQTKLIQTQLTQDEQSWAAQNAALQTTIGNLSQTIAKRDAQDVQQQKVDSTLSAQEAAQRLAQQTQAAPGEVTASGNSVVLDTPVSRTVVSRLDVLADTQSDLVDTKKALADETAVATNNANDAVEQKKLVVAQQTQLVDAQKACDAKVSAVKAQARKSKFKWFLGGLVAGFTLGHLY